MFEKRLNYDQNGNYIGYSIEEGSVSSGYVDFTNLPAIDADDAIGMWLWCLLIDFVSFIISLGVFRDMLWVGTCLISTILLLVMISMVIGYLIKPIKTGKKWVADSVVSLIVLLFYLAIHIIVIITCS